MDTCRLLQTATLTVECPHCGQSEDDDFEVIDAARINSMRCPACAKIFHFALIECEGCSAEYVFSWTARPEVFALKPSTCMSCRGQERQHETTTTPPAVRA